MAKTITTLELSLSSSLLILLLIIGFSYQGASGGVCDLRYLKAPPSIISCNPYSNSAGLLLECQVQVPASVGSRVEIQWFFNATSQATLHITDPVSFPPLLNISFMENQSSMHGDVWTISSRIIFSSLTSPTHQGMYYCEIALDGSISSLSPSDSVLVENEDESDYLNLHPCSDSEVFVQDTMKCAGNISASTKSVLVSTTVAPIVTTSSNISLTAAHIATTSSNISLTIYLPVAVAAMFGMIIVVLSILSVRLYLKKIKTSKLHHTSDALNNVTMVQTEIHGLSVEKPLKADEDMTMNKDSGIAPEPEKDAPISQ